MHERHLQAIVTERADGQSAAEVRERLKGRFPPGSTRRMTTLGMMVGASLSTLGPTEADSIVYASGYAESCALEGFLESFPTPSPTLFQTSIHPSAVQQLMIGRQLPVGEFLPHSGGGLLPFHALRAAILSPAPRVIVCGGEETGTWLLRYGLASNRTFAFAAAITREAAPGSAARISLSPDTGAGELGLSAWFDVVDRRTDFNGCIAPGWRLRIEWL